MAQTLVEKITQRYAVGIEEGREVLSGDYVFIRPAYVMTHDNTAAVIPKFSKIGARKFASPRQAVLTLDHNIQDQGKENISKYRKIEQFAEEMGVDFYPAGRGIGHQIMCEEGYAWPGTMAVASDSHANMYGGLGCLGTPVVRTDAAAIWATGQTWWQVPPVARAELTGRLQPGVTGKDVIVTLCGVFNKDEVLNHAVEFTGEAVPHLTMNDRLTISNMSTEWGALAGIFPADDTTISWLRERAKLNPTHPRLNEERISILESNRLTADPGASYAKELMLDLSTVRPHISGPDHVKVMTSVTEIEKCNIMIDKAYLVSCVNSRVEDLTEAAAVARGKKVARDVEFYVAAASSEVQAESERRGDWQALVEAGAIPLPPGCGPCIGLGMGLLEPGETGISATNRNFKGRMGSREAQAYLGSPSVVAASAVAGRIVGPQRYDSVKPSFGIRVSQKPKNGRTTVNLLTDFPRRLEGDLIFCYQDNLNTDGIFPGKYTYIDSFTREQQAGVVMENYDPEFGTLAKKGDILVGGFNFGTGSSREQAATALKYRGILLVMAGSFGATYKRNALNNGFLLLEVPELVQDMKDRFGEEQLTIRTGLHAVIDSESSIVRVDDRMYAVSPVGENAQELILAGGLEPWVKRRNKED